MDHLTIPERVSVLETEKIELRKDIDEIKSKLDDLLHLKSKGIGAFWLVGLLISSGLLGLFSTVINLFNGKPHL